MHRAQLFDVEGHVALVTGAASGLGLAYAEVMAENGATVVLVDANADALGRETARLSAAGRKVAGEVLDVTDSRGLQAAIDGAAARHGRLDAVFANAGTSAGPGFVTSPSGELEALDLDTFNRVLSVNLTAAVLTVRFAAVHMKRRRSGSIVATTSIAGLRAEPLVGYAYVATKAALGNVVRQAAVELAPHNVRVNAIAPGPFFTNIRNRVMHRDPSVAARFAELVPLGRVAQPDEIKGLALLLASPAGSFITGTVIPIDGGTTAR